MAGKANDTTVGITLRLPTKVLQVYTEIAHRANLMELEKGKQGMSTAQDAIRHRLASLPEVVAALNNKAQSEV